MDLDLADRDCGHRSCRFLTRVFALGRPVPKRCRRWCPAAASIATLDQLGRGQTGRILRVGGRPAARRRLLELGVVRGETITLQRAAPLGDPLEFLVKGYHLSLRRRDAAAITIETLAAAGVVLAAPGEVLESAAAEVATAA
ncbi:MAG TPA: ferrous iron transport protein A [Candidatus Limnocylindrales bacterium]|nr:ferrous iron transport protein A [Candidatus Limnocylindrales bacterium]